MNLQIMKNFPKEMYVREGRRIRGRYIFSENDASLSSDFERTLFKRTQWQ